MEYPRLRGITSKIASAPASGTLTEQPAPPSNPRYQTIGLEVLLEELGESASKLIVDGGLTEDESLKSLIRNASAWYVILRRRPYS